MLGKRVSCILEGDNEGKVFYSLHPKGLVKACFHGPYFFRRRLAHEEIYLMILT